MITTISIAEHFSRSPAGRTPADGPFNGQRFREELLVPALRAAISSGGEVVVDLDGAYSYSSSFLEEVFGGLVRSQLFAPKQIRRVLKISAGSAIYKSFQYDAMKYLEDAMNTAEDGRAVA